LTILGVSLVPPTAATEKHWIAHETEAIVVGKLTASPIFPWVDGWHINGVIRVDETLYGDRLPGQINFHFVCRWDAMCRWWPAPVLPPMFKERAYGFCVILTSATGSRRTAWAFSPFLTAHTGKTTSGVSSGEALTPCTQLSDIAAYPEMAKAARLR
jgi:hypothetical protein